MVSLPLNCSDADILAVAEEWTARLAAEDYAGAFDMLFAGVTARSWVSNAEQLRAWIVNYGTGEPLPGEPSCVVTPTATAEGERWRWLPSLTRTVVPEGYAGSRGRLDWQLPLNGEWSDLVATFELEERNAALVFVLTALRVP